MIHEIEETQIIKKQVKTCDVCGATIKRDLACSVARCEICGIDLCNKCVYHEEWTSGDYREVYCKTCWETGEKYRYKIKLLESEIEQLDNEWRSVCEKKREKLNK